MSIEYVINAVIEPTCITPASILCAATHTIRTDKPFIININAWHHECHCSVSKEHCLTTMAPATAGRGAPMPAATLIRAAPTVPAAAPGGSCADRKNHCHKERGYNDKFWINDLKSDINQERDSSA